LRRTIRPPPCSCRHKTRHCDNLAAPKPVTSSQQLSFEGPNINLDKREVLRCGERIDLAGAEFDLSAGLIVECSGLPGVDADQPAAGPVS
jgi:DNA-binding response OmpR family regulator